ncbi:MAG: hypothetical protein ACI83H_002792, partial [Glaciecola sp.]
MNKISKEYGNYISSIKWNYSGVIRRHFALNEINSNKMLNSLVSHDSIDRVFYAIEKDTVDDSMTHAHLLIKARGKYNFKRLAKELGINPKAVYLEEVLSNKKVSRYVT